ncbi:hypothetical protein EV702DRAFT_1237500 [Suillus placidus]|uniref:Uncharacterized protein n=1 Tax=Suillus placidus TaxID=48579 RepID=A0A9P6ZRF2_9AGAM|nr:hypothetical protein EV702DRAFT_1237500 [Suillus placidus]
MKKWPRVPQTLTSNADEATRSISTEPGQAAPHARDQDLPTNEDQHDHFDFDPPDYVHDADEEHGPARAHVAAQPPIRDFNFHPVVLPDVRIPGSDQDQEDQPSLVPRAFQERPGVRLAYLNAVVGNVFGNHTVQAATESLNNQLNCMLVEGVLPEHPRPVRHLLSAKRRLGIDPDQWITQYAICSECWKHYTLVQLRELLSPSCTVPDCSGLLYDEHVDAKGKIVRTAKKIMPHVSLIGSLRRMFMRPGFAKSIRDSRHDQPRRNDDEDFVMTDMHDGTLWHELETNTIREIGELGTIRDCPQDNRPMATKITEHRYGLHLTLNIDWMGILNNRPHSTGPIYYAINDLPRDQRYLQVNVICAAIMPGPKEPNVQQINHCLEPSSREVMELKNGVKMDIHGEDEPENIFADNAILDCDMPASHKCNGTAGHSHDFHPCAFCDVDIVKVMTPEGYDNSWTPKDDYQMLRQSFYSRDATQAHQDAILKDFGVRWSILNLISGWLPSKKLVLDFMHAIFLGIISHLFMRVLFGGYMLSVRWPSHITRLPKNLGENQSLKKSDEWRRLLTVTPVVLWWSWRDENDEIPDKEPPLPPNTVQPDFSRNCRSLYQTILLLCTGVCILSSRTISMSQAWIGQSFISHYCLESLQLRIPLTINHHASMHISEMIRKVGPVYAWWLFAFERFNGMLERTHLIYEYLLALPPDTYPFEREQINRIIKVQAQTRGSMMSQIAVYQSEAAEDNVRLPLRAAKFIDLRSHGLPGVFYTLLLEYCRRLWPQLRLVNDLSHDDGTPFLASKVACMLTYIRKDGIRYGCTMNHRTQSDSLGFISWNSTRVPIQIIGLFVVGILDVVPHICAVTRYGSTLGIHVSYANEFGPYEIIPISNIECPLALIPVHSAIIKKDLWIAVSFDHSGNEPEDLLDDDDFQ